MVGAYSIQASSRRNACAGNRWPAMRRAPAGLRPADLRAATAYRRGHDRCAGVSTTPRAARVEHALENAAAGELTLSGEEEARLDRAFPRGRPGRGVPVL